jgi:hypothetical protein
MRFGPALLLLPLLAACVAVPPASQPGPTGPPVVRPPVTGVPPTRAVTPPSTGFRAPQVHRVPGLEGVIEQDATRLARLFGQPRLDVREGDARKLQFAGQACVLDVFLYPLRPGAEPVATYVEARRASDGAEVDRAACAQALRR